MEDLGRFLLAASRLVANAVVRRREKLKFAQDSPLEGDGFEPSVPRKFLWCPAPASQPTHRLSMGIEHPCDQDQFLAIGRRRPGEIAVFGLDRETTEVEQMM